MSRRDEVLKNFFEQENYTKEKVNSGIEENRKGYFKIEIDAEESVVQACMNLGAAGVMVETCDTEKLLNREDAAIMLVKALEIVRNR